VVKKQLARLISAYPAATVDEGMLETWMKRMGRYSPSIVTKTVDVLIDNCRFFPSVAEFAEMAESERMKEKQAKMATTRSACDTCVSGWVLHDEPTDKTYADGDPIVKTTASPCPTCLPDPYEKWRAGEYEPARM
jgi:hypothetical protein